MTIETKYNIGDEVFWVSSSTYIGGVVEYGEIHCEFNQRGVGITERYTIRSYDDVLYVKEAEDLDSMNNEVKKIL